MRRPLLLLATAAASVIGATPAHADTTTEGHVALVGPLIVGGAGGINYIVTGVAVRVPITDGVSLVEGQCAATSSAVLAPDNIYVDCWVTEPPTDNIYPIEGPGFFGQLGGGRVGTTTVTTGFDNEFCVRVTGPGHDQAYCAPFIA